MAEDITASSMGQAIGLGYRTKDIGPQLMQFQAGELARRSAERNAAKKEKKAEKDKFLEKLIPYETKNLNKKVQQDAIDYMAEARKRITDRVKEQDMEGATKEFVIMAQDMNQLEKESVSFDNLQLKMQDPSQLIIKDVSDWASSTDPEKRKPTQDQVEQWAALGIPYDPKTNTIDYRGIKIRNDIAEFDNYKPDKEVFIQNGVTPITRVQPKVAGQLSQVTQVYVPNPAMYDAHRERLLSDNEFVANAVNRISRERKMSYGDLAIETQKQMIIDDPTLEGKVTYNMVNKQIARNDYNQKINKDKWISEHTVDENMNPVPRATGGGKSGKDDVPPNPADVAGAEHLDWEVRKMINETTFKNTPDSEIIRMINNPQNKKEKELSDLAKPFLKSGKSFTKNYPGVQVSEVNDNFTIPSTGKTVAISEIYYNTDDKRYYIATHKTPGKSGVTESMMPALYPMNAKDLNAIKSRASGGNAALKDALEKINANAKGEGYPTIDYWIQTHSGGGTGSVNTNSTGGKKQKVKGF
jgi:hypothetical protein